MRATDFLEGLTRLLGFAVTISALPADNTLNTVPGAQSTVGASGSIDLSEPALAENASSSFPLSKRNPLNPLFVASSVLGIYSFLKDTIEEIKAMYKEAKGKGSTQMLSVAVQPPLYGEGEKPDSRYHTYPEPYDVTLNTEWPDMWVHNTYGQFANYDGQVGFEGEYPFHHTQFQERPIRAGSVASRHVPHEAQSIYTIYRAKRPICIVWGGNAQDSERGGTKYLFTGDIGWLCGAPWYWGGQYITSDSEYQSRCFWLSPEPFRHLDEPLDVPQGVQIRWPAFSEGNLPLLQNLSMLCNPVDFDLRWSSRNDIIHKLNIHRVDDLYGGRGQLKNTRPSEAKNRTEESQRKLPHWLHEELVLDDVVLNSARELCESPSSYGPDFLNVQEGLFCDMDSKKLWPVCGYNITEARCFQMEAQRLILTNYPEVGSELESREVREPYKRITDYRLRRQMIKKQQGGQV